MTNTRNSAFCDEAQPNRTASQYGQLANYFSIGKLEKTTQPDNKYNNSIEYILTYHVSQYLGQMDIASLICVSRPLYTFIYSEGTAPFIDEATPYYNALLDQSLLAYIRQTKEHLVRTERHQTLLFSAPDGLNRSAPFSRDLNTIIANIIGIGFAVGLLSMGPTLMIALLTNTANENDYTLLSHKFMLMMGSMALSIAFVCSWELLQRFRASQLPSQLNQAVIMAGQADALKSTLLTTPSLLPTQTELLAKVRKLESFGLFANRDTQEVDDIETQLKPSLKIIDQRIKAKRN